MKLHIFALLVRVSVHFDQFCSTAAVRRQGRRCSYSRDSRGCPLISRPSHSRPLCSPPFIPYQSNPTHSLMYLALAFSRRNLGITRRRLILSRGDNVAIQCERWNAVQYSADDFDIRR